jgi:hypothetical protein
MTSVHDVPTAHTPPGGYGEQMPAPFLAGCAEPLVEGAPDLRGTWRVEHAESGGSPLPDGHPIWQHVERVEQAGDRVVITGSGIVHDMVADGTEDHGVHDVMAADFTTPIVVAASYEGGVLVLRPQGVPGVEVRRRRDGEAMIWKYHTLFAARLVRVDGAGGA